MNINATNIYKHIKEHLLFVDENINADCSINFNFIEADVVMDIREGKLVAVESYDDIDAAFDRIAAEYS